MSAVYLLRIYVFFLQRMEWKPFVYLKYYFEFRLHWTYTDSYSVRMNVWSGDKYCIQDTLACLCIDCSFRLELVRFRLSRLHIFHLHCIMDNPWMNYKCFEQEMSLNTFENFQRNLFASETSWEAQTQERKLNLWLKWAVLILFYCSNTK